MARPVDKEAFGARVAARREQLGMTQKALAHAIGMKQQGLGEIERGNVERPRLLRELAAALRVSEDWLLYGEGPEPEAPVSVPASPTNVSTDRRLAAQALLMKLPDDLAEAVFHYMTYLWHSGSPEGRDKPQ